MKLLKELLNEIWGGGRAVADERAWRAGIEQQATGEREFWLVSPTGKKYGPFPTPDRAKQFFASRADIHRGSQLKSVPKGSRV